MAIFSIFAIQTITLALHEGAHLAVASAFGMFPVTVELGRGETVAQLKGSRVSLVLKSWPTCGMVIPSYPKHGVFRPWQSAVLSLAGPAVDLLMFLVVVWLLGSPPELWRDMPGGNQLELVLGVTAGYLVYSHLREFWPRTAQTERGEMPNDMGNVWSLAKKKWKSPGLAAFSQAFEHYVEARDDTSANQVRAAFGNAIARCRDLAERDYLKDYLCTGVLFYRLSELLDLANSASAELLRDHPDELTFRGTRGGVLVELGESEGAVLLEDVVNQSCATHDCSISAAFLAIFHYRGQNSELAYEWLEKARGFNPECPALRRAMSEIDPRGLDKGISSSEAS